MPKFAVIIVAAGRSTRFGGAYKKPFAPLCGRAVWLHSAEKFLGRSDVAQVVVVVAKEDREEFERKFGANIAILGIDVVNGGAERTDSVAAGLAKVSGAELVAVHDAARPCVRETDIDKVFEAARETGAAILASPVASTLKRSEGDVIKETVPRDNMWAAQTPQAFRRNLLEQAYGQDGRESATDDAGLVERLGHEVRLVEGSAFNLKITTAADLNLAELILKSAPPPKPKGVSHPFADDDLWR